MQDLAADTTLGTFTPVQLYAGESDIVTNYYDAAAGVAFGKYEVFAVDATGKAIKYDNAGASPANVAVGITAQAIAAGARGPAFVGGSFNHAALTWPAGLTTFPLRRAAFARTNINIAELK